MHRRWCCGVNQWRLKHLPSPEVECLIKHRHVCVLICLSMVTICWHRQSSELWLLYCWFTLKAVSSIDTADSNAYLLLLGCCFCRASAGWWGCMMPACLASLLTRWGSARLCR